MQIDFKEIPKANVGGNNQDIFELFARDFLEAIGYKILEEPARGADGGKDLIVAEKEQNHELRWLVSCKHFAHSKNSRSVTPKDEQDILDRVKSKRCVGFIGFYSTIPSEGLINKLRSLSEEIGFKTFDREKIETFIVGYFEREQLFLRYFPQSYKIWKESYYYTEPVKLFNFYFDEKYRSFSHLFEIVFGVKENIIKLLKNFNSIEEVFSFQNFKIVVCDEVIDLVFRPKTKIEEKTPQKTMNKIAALEIPQFLFDQKNINLFEENAKKVHMFLIAHDIEPSKPYKMVCERKEGSFSSADICLLYSNHIIATTTLYKDLNKMFSDLKEMLS